MRWILCAAACLSFLGQSYAVNGKAVCVVEREKGCSWCSDDAVVPFCKIVTFDIQGNTVQSRDTLLDGWFRMPRFSLDGTRIAFYEGDGDSVYISVCNLQTRQVTHLAKLPAWPSRAHNLSWPVGDWVYYQMTDPAGDVNWKTNNEIWRVNATTRQNEYVYNYSPGSKSYCWLKRWNCSADGKWATSMIEPTSGGSNITFHCFPPEEPVDASDYMFFTRDFNTSDCPAKTGLRACNNSLSPGGNFLTHYEGWHGELWLEYWNRSTGTLTKNTKTYAGCYQTTICNPQVTAWAGADPDNYDTGEWPLFSCNSEKWICLTINVGGFDRIGTNQFLINWVDNQAIQTTRNPFNATNPDNFQKVKNTPYYSGMDLELGSGDFFVSGGPTNAWQDTSGLWHTPSGGIVSAAPRPNSMRRPASAFGNSAAVHNLRGALVGSLSGRDVSRVLSHGAYIVNRTGDFGASELCKTVLATR